jgi:thiol:disulfide interchange protein
LTVNRLLKPVIVLLASIYFVLDAVFMTVARPIADWLAERRILDGLRRWIASLRPYPTLALFAVPVIILEPVKPVSAYLAATGHVMLAMAIFILGEILKLVLVERLFVLSRDKLMSIPAFAWSYRQYRQVMDWIVATDAWQAVRRTYKIAQYHARSYVLELRTSRRPVGVSFQPR